MFFEARKSSKFKSKTELTQVEREPIPYQLMTFAELSASVGKEFICDVECYVNYFLVAFRCRTTKKVCYFEMSQGESLDTQLLSYTMWSVCTIGFNTKRYDNIMIAAAIAGHDCATLKQISDKIIDKAIQAREDDLAEEYKFKPLRRINYIDLFDPCPLTDSLKKYAARMHAKRLQELPYPPDSRLTENEIAEVKNYCIGGDTVNTDLLAEELKEQLSLRVNLGAMYGFIDLRSKSDAQIAETVIVAELNKLRDRRMQKPNFDLDYSFAYKAPEYIQFQTPQLQEILERIKGLRFTLSANGSPKCTELTGSDELKIEGMKAIINGRGYALGVGGLHSMEKAQSIKGKLYDTDVESYYPKLILNNEWFPTHLGRDFLQVFSNIVDRRLKAKADAKQAGLEAENYHKNTAGYKHFKEKEKSFKVVADSLKITINGSFGKLGSVFSMLYSPDLLIQTTVTGQLTLLMAIEACELAGIPVYSANTDGFVVMCEDEQRDLFKAIISGFERHTNLRTEETPYSAIYARDVNNYIAVKPDGKVKVKGVYSEVGSTGNSRLSKNPAGLIIADAVIAFLTKGTPIKDTVENCKDITRFLCVQNVKGGGHQNGRYLGKTVRWIYGRSIRETINYVDSGNNVPDSFGAVPLMDLPDQFPDYIDYDRYINFANQALIDIGYVKPASLF